MESIMDGLTAILMSPASLYLLMIFGLVSTIAAAIELRTIYLRAKAELSGLAAAINDGDKIDFASHYQSYRKLAFATTFGRDKWIEFEAQLMFPRQFDANPVIKASQPPNEILNKQTICDSYLKNNLLLLLPHLHKGMLSIGLVVWVALPLIAVFENTTQNLQASSIDFSMLGKGIKGFGMIGGMWWLLKLSWSTVISMFGQAVEPYVDDVVFRLNQRVEYLSVQQAQFYTLQEQRQHTEALRELVDKLGTIPYFDQPRKIVDKRSLAEFARTDHSELHSKSNVTSPKPSETLSSNKRKKAAVDSDSTIQ